MFSSGAVAPWYTILAILTLVGEVYFGTCTGGTLCYGSIARVFKPPV